MGGWALLVGIGLCGQGGWAAEKKEQPSQPGWSERMMQMRGLMEDLLPLVFNAKKFEDKSNDKKILSLTKKLSGLSHEVRSKAKEQADPSIAFISGMFKDEAGRAYTELMRGNRRYARSILQSVAHYCTSCHTRSNQGPKFISADKILADTSMGDIEKAEMMTAVREFDPAMELYRKIVADGGIAKKDSFQWDGAIQRALTLAVRVKRDPAAAREIVVRVLENPGTYLFLKGYANAWKKSVDAWEKESSRTFNSDTALMVEAQRLLALAESTNQDPMDRSGEIEYLRASAVLHDLLSMAKDPETQAKALLLLGRSYDALRGLGLWTLHEHYYEACIRVKPHSDVSKQCYERYEGSVYYGYSGSGGTFIPEDVQKKLDELKKLAF